MMALQYPNFETVPEDWELLEVNAQHPSAVSNLSEPEMPGVFFFVREKSLA